MALGGAATGSMKAKVAARQAATISPIGFTPIETAIEATIGYAIVAVAVFDVNSVINRIIATTTIRMIMKL